MKPRSVLFTNWVDAENYNAQSLNVREIALRLDPARFVSTLFYEKEPDARLRNYAQIRLLPIPRRLGTVRMLAEMMRGYDFHFRANLLRATQIYLKLPRVMRSKTKVVDWLEGPTKPYAELSKNPQVGLFREIQARVDYRVAVTEYVAQTYREDFGLRTDALIPAGVDTRHFVPPARREHAQARVLFVGHYIERKNPHAVLIAARRFPNAHFTLVGAARDGFGERVRGLARKWHLENVTFQAPVNRDGLRTLMWENDILFHPSKIESIAKVVLEGGATGMPGILYDYYHSPAVEDGVTGYQVKTFDEMMEKLGWLIEDRALRERMGAAAVEFVKKFDWDVIVREWAEFLSGIAE